MNQVNEFAAQMSTLAKNSYERGTELTQLMTEEATKMAEHQMDQTRELMDLGFQTQRTLVNEFVQGLTNARDMWWDSLQSWNQKTTPLKATKAS